MVCSVSGTFEGRFILKRKIIDFGEIDDSVSFVQVFESMKAGLVDGVPPGLGRLMMPCTRMIDACEEILIRGLSRKTPPV